MSAEDREEMINLMIIMDGKGVGYYERMGNEELLEAYDRLMNVEPME